MNSKSDVNRRVLAIQAKKKRHKPNKKKGKLAANAVPGSGGPVNSPVDPETTDADSAVLSNNVVVSGGCGGDSGSSSGTGAPAGKKQKSIKKKSSFTSTTNSEQENKFQEQQPAEVPPPSQQDLNRKFSNQGLPPRSSSNESDQSEVNSDYDEQELMTDYCFGGYHPVKIGDLYQGKLFGTDKQLYSALVSRLEGVVS